MHSGLHTRSGIWCFVVGLLALSVVTYLMDPESKDYFGSAAFTMLAVLAILVHGDLKRLHGRVRQLEEQSRDDSTRASSDPR